MNNNFSSGQPDQANGFFTQSPSPSLPESKPPLKKSNKVLITVSLLVLVLLGGVIAFAYMKKIGPFSVSSYTESNFFSALLEKSSTIDSLAYSISASFGVNPREEDAKPFIVSVSNTPELREKYQNDAERAKNISSIISLLRYSHYTYSTQETQYPTSLKKIVENDTYGSVSINDPVSKKEYMYTLTENGNNFKLAVMFETRDAISSIKESYGYTATNTVIEDMKVTFTKDSPYYFYLSPEPPKPLFVSLQEQARYFPPDIKALMSISASSDLKSETAGWLFNLNAEGDFGDLTYKVNVDAFKKDADYYFKVNNIPSLFLGDLASLKGKWVKISTESASSSDTNQYSTLGYVAKEIPEYEQSYKENRQNFMDLAKQIISIADAEKLILFKKAPRHEQIEGRELTRYELSIRKEAILPFYTKIRDVVAGNDKYKDFDSLADQGMLEYLQSKEFSEVFDYYDKNVEFVFWTDSSGFPAMLEVGMRIVPPDTATQLSDKQFDVVFKGVIKDINKPLNIKAPGDALPIEEVMKDFEKNMYGYDASGLANTKINLSSLRAFSELVYDKNSGYGTKSFPVGPCKQTASTLFGDKEVYSAIDKATGGSPSKATCASKPSAYAVSVPLTDSPEYSWCVDSTGTSKQITGAIKKESCN